MRALFGSIASLIALTAPVAANQCYWVGNQIYCDAMCRVTDRWFQGGREWMRYTCGPPPEIIVAGVLIVLIIIIVAGIASATNSHQSYITKIQDAERDTAANNAIEREMQETMQKADAHIAAMLAKYRDGGRHD